MFVTNVLLLNACFILLVGSVIIAAIKMMMARTLLPPNFNVF